MRVLVTGGTGFIGSHLAEKFLRHGHEVRVLGLADTPSDRANAEVLRSMGAKIHEGSITDAELCRRAVAGATHVYHLAVAMREAGLSDDYFMRVNLDGTRALLDAAYQEDTERFIFCGTIGIFGHRFNGIANEDSPKSPGNIYEKTKLAAEELALEYHQKYGLRTSILRPADVYGPRDQRLLKLFKRVSKGRFPLFGSGSGRRHMIYVDDVVSAFEAASHSEEAVGIPIIIAGPQVCTLHQLLDQVRIAAGQVRFGYRFPLSPMLLIAALTEDICKRIGVTPPIYRRRMDFFTSDCQFDISRAREKLGWQPIVPLKEGVALTLAAYEVDGSIVRSDEAKVV